MMFRGTTYFVCLVCLLEPTQAAACDWLAGAQYDPGQADLPQGAVCSQTGDTVCYWRYGYRSEAARYDFESLGARLEACLGAEIATDAPVNHPDSYELRAFQGQGGRFYVSLKDKSALQETYVFLRAEAATP